MTDKLRLFLFRHGETEWALTGKHTGRTDIPLTEKGREQARALRSITKRIDFSAVLTSPLARARETADLAGFEGTALIDPNLAEIDYGKFEGVTTATIRETVPGWTVWTHPCPGGETLQQAWRRATSVIDRAKSVGGDVAVFSHAHMLRVLTVTWLQLPTVEGRHFTLDTGTVSILAREHESPSILVWNAPSDFQSIV